MDYKTLEGYVHHVRFDFDLGQGDVWDSIYCYNSITGELMFIVIFRVGKCLNKLGALIQVAITFY